MRGKNRTTGKTDKMLERAVKLKPIQIAPDTFAVPSSSDANKGYVVRFVSGKLECNCTGYKYRFECSHLLAVDGLIDKLVGEF